MTFGWHEPEPTDRHTLECPIWASDNPLEVCDCGGVDPFDTGPDPDELYDTARDRRAS